MIGSFYSQINVRQVVGLNLQDFGRGVLVDKDKVKLGYFGLSWIQSGRRYGNLGCSSYAPSMHVQSHGMERLDQQKQRRVTRTSCILGLSIMQGQMRLIRSGIILPQTSMEIRMNNIFLRFLSNQLGFHHLWPLVLLIFKANEYDPSTLGSLHYTRSMIQFQNRLNHNLQYLSPLL